MLQVKYSIYRDARKLQIYKGKFAKKTAPNCSRQRKEFQIKKKKEKKQAMQYETELSKTKNCLDRRLFTIYAGLPDQDRHTIIETKRLTETGAPVKNLLPPDTVQFYEQCTLSFFSSSSCKAVSAS